MLLIAGSLIFLIGASIGVPAVFSTADRGAKRRLLENHMARWQLAQPLYALGPIVAAVGVGLIATGLEGAVSVTLCLAAAVLLLAGACTWSYSCYLRGVRPIDFALGKLPGWPFTTYVLLTLGGLALLGVSLLTSDHPGWIGWFVLGADVAFLALYVALRDIPPFLFYLLLILVGAVVAID